MAELYNLKNVNELADGDESFVLILAQTFLEEVPPDLESMALAVAENDAKTAYQYAHKMKPSFQMFGIDLLSQIKRIESWSKGSISHDEAKETLSLIQETANEAIQAIKNDF